VSAVYHYLSYAVMISWIYKCMVALIRELANTLFPSTTKHLLSSLKAQNSFNMDMDIDTDILRERSVFSNNNSSRESLMHSKLHLFHTI